MDELFIPVQIKTRVQLNPKELYGDIDHVILGKLQNTYEGRCSRFGFIRPGSIEITSRSAGILLKSHFNGHIMFHVKCVAMMCNPVVDMVLYGIVRNKNQLGIMAETLAKADDGTKYPVLDVIIPMRTAGIVSEVPLTDYEVGDTIYFQVVGKRLQANEKKIYVIGRAVKKPSGTKKPATAAIVADDEPLEGDQPEEIYDLDDVEDEEQRGGGGSDEEDEHSDEELTKGDKVVELPKLGGDDSEEEDADDEDVEDDFDEDVTEAVDDDEAVFEDD